jgi:hypothetical protein
MIEHSFELIPFPDSSIPKINVTGSVVREGNVLTIQYTLSGTVDDIQFPSLTPQPGRRNGLWLATCFEFFLALVEQPQYWEFNLSPSGDWNVYRMNAYRQISFQEEELITDLSLEMRKEMDCYHLGTLVDLNPVLSGGMPLLMGVSSVIQTLDGHETYWALTHPRPQADFHLRESFILTL